MMSIPSGSRPGRPHRDPIDAPEAVRAASSGFSILVIGGLLAPLAAAFLPIVGQFWISLVAAGAFAVAGNRVGEAAAAHLHGACAALGSYLLVLPLLFWLAPEATLNLVQIVGTAVVAVVVGGVAGALAGRRRDRSARSA